jgi:acyl dehydratase
MVIQSEAPGYDTRMLHGEHDVTLLAPILPGMHLRARAAVVGIEVKSSGTLVVVRTETRNEKGGLMNYQYATNFVRGVQAPRSAGERAPTHEPANDVDHRNPVARVGYHVDKDQTYRYAEASGDRGPYHLDEAVAKSAGFPGLILHGLCTMALGSRAVVETVCSHDGTRVKRLAVRFTRPVLLGQDITTTIWAAGKGPRSHMYAFEIVDASGQAVIKKGLAEVATGAQ